MRATAFLVVFLMPTLVAWAQAEDQPVSGEVRTSEALVKEAQSLAKRGDLQAAIARFKEASRVRPSAETFCYISLAYRRLERWPQAQLFLERSRKEVGSFPAWCGRDLAVEIEEALKEHSPVDIHSDPAGATVRVGLLAPDETFPTPGRLWLPRGSHEIALSHPDRPTKAVQITVDPPRPLAMNVVLEPNVNVLQEEPSKKKPAESPGTSTKEKGTALVEPTLAKRSPVDQASAKRSAWPWVAVSSGALALGGGVYYYLRARDTSERASMLPPGDTFDSLVATFERQRILAYSLSAAGIATMGLGAYLLLRPSEPRADGPPVARLEIGPRTGMLIFSMRF
ncbi:MAG: hypothetical protein HY698_01375 [Deltaproteobacteria bacterium]|nr:hypothetical protein [Deltaproteobacteria bacterium]